MKLTFATYDIKNRAKLRIKSTTKGDTMQHSNPRHCTTRISVKCDTCSQRTLRNNPQKRENHWDYKVGTSLSGFYISAAVKNNQTPAFPDINLLHNATGYNYTHMPNNLSVSSLLSLVGRLPLQWN
jgi:hypothetical protein